MPNVVERWRVTLSYALIVVGLLFGQVIVAWLT